MKLSVIIPVYNVRATLARCVESVLAQVARPAAGLGNGDMEVIIVDDGSTDGSAALADTFRSRTGVTVIHQANAGLSAARNAGLGVARGDLVTFVDSDDWLAPSTYAPLVRMMDGDGLCDIIEYSLVRETAGGLRAITFPDKTYADMRGYWIDGQAYTHCYAWNKLYRRRLFDGVRFPVGRTFEDVFTLPALLRHARRVRTTSAGLYHYSSNPQGITQQAIGNDYRNLLAAHMPLVADKGLRDYPGFADYYLHVLNIQLTTFQLTGDRRDIILPAPAKGMPPPADGRYRWKLRLLRVLGMTALCRLLRLINNHRNQN